MKALLRWAGLVALSVWSAGCVVSPPGSIPQPKYSGPTGLVVSPTSLSMAPSDAATVTSTEYGYTGGYTASTGNPNVATVVANGASQFIVTAVATGITDVTVADSNGHSIQVSVSVQVTVIGGQ